MYGLILSKKDRKKKYIDTEKAIKRLWLFYLVIGIQFGILVFVINDGIANNRISDFPNLSTLFVEIGFGIAITITVYLFSKRMHEENKEQQNKITNMLQRIEKIEHEQQKIFDEQHALVKNERERIEHWKASWGELILTYLDGIKNMYDILEDWLTEYQKNPSLQQKENIIGSTKRNGEIVNVYIQNIRRDVPKIENYFDDPTLGFQLLGFSEQLSTLFDSLEMEHHWESNLEPTFQVIAERKKILSKNMERMKNEIPNRITKQS